MSRLAAKEKGLYYPTDVDVVRLFAKTNISLKGRIFHLFDPCAGEGIALRTFTQALDNDSYRTFHTHGIEIEKTRAEEARKNIETFMVGAFENFSFNGSPDAIFFNPPYDDMNGKRVELDWISNIARAMDTNTKLIAVLPALFFEGGRHHNDFRLCLYQNGLMPVARDGDLHNVKQEDRICALQFPEPQYQAFKQSIIVLEKVGYQLELMKKIPVVGIVGEYKRRITIGSTDSTGYSSGRRGGFSGYTAKVEEKKFEMIYNGDAERLPSIFEEEENIIKLFGVPKKEIPITPLMPMRDEILAAVIAGGLFNGIRIEDTVVRGGSNTEQVKKVEVSHGGTEQTETITNVLVAHISELDLNTGEIKTFKSNSDEFGPKIERVAQLVRDLMNEKSPSIYQADDRARLLKKIEKVHAPRIMANGDDDLLDTQKTAAAMVLRGWESTKSVFLMGEMGVGKTITGLASAVGQVINRGPNKQKIVLLIPSKNDLVDKWMEEISNSCRDIPHTVVDVQTISDVQKAFAMKGMVFIVVKESMVKRTSGVQTIYMRGMTSKSRKAKCFSCGKESQLLNAAGKLPEKDNEVLYCSECKVKYETSVRDRNKNAYASLARYINDHYAKSYVLVIDEAHQMKGGDSARGYASGSLIRGAWRVLMMTGTFYNGFASSMFFNLYRCSGNFRVGNTYDGVADFVTLYGLEEVTTKTTRDDGTSRSWSGYGVKKTTKTKEIPGIHPAMIGLMLPYTVFMKLSDMNTILPPQREHTLFTDMEDEPKGVITSYLEKIKEKAMDLMRDRYMRAEGTSLFGQYIWAKSGAYDMAPIGDYISASSEKFSFSAQNKESRYSKEEALLRIVADTKRKGFPTLVYYIQSDRRPIYGRLSEMFEAHGMKIVEMGSNEKSRIAFIKNALANGADAILCNANLVREGIDLLMFRTIAWYGVTSDAILVNQANARIHRIGKKWETDVYYLGYNSTHQAAQWTVTGKKVLAMQSMHGDVKAGLAALLGGSTMITDIQDSMIKYERYESDMVLDDLPEIGFFTHSEPKQEPKAKKVQTKTLEEWKQENLTAVSKVAREPKKRVEVTAQISMF